MRTFAEIADNLNEYLDSCVKQLINSNPIIVNQVGYINGIYVFFENGLPIYVGRSNKNRMQMRLQEHMATYATKSSATFAYLLYKEMLQYDAIKNVPANDKDFLLAKERVRKMQIRILEVNDPIIQTVLEPYIAHKLETLDKYNKFMTH